MERSEPETAPPTLAVEVRVHPLEEARRALLSTPPDTPHYAEVLSEVRARLEALDLSRAPEPTSAMTCALAQHAVPLVPLQATGSMHWNGTRFDDMEITDDMVARWCDDLVAAEQIDCSMDPEGDSHWIDLCGECERGRGPSLADRRRARAHGVAACEAWGHLRSRCAAHAVLSRADALGFAESCRYDAEAVFESGNCSETVADTDPVDDLELVIELLEQLASGEPADTE